jgi:hypothetical protein
MTATANHRVIARKGTTNRIASHARLFTTNAAASCSSGRKNQTVPNVDALRAVEAARYGGRDGEEVPVFGVNGGEELAFGAESH